MPGTLSFVIGGKTCNANCNFCVARMTKAGSETPENLKEPEWGNFDATIKFALLNGVSTVLMTGKGEPTLWPDQITDVLAKLKNTPIAIKELQTNAIPIMRNLENGKDMLSSWRMWGLNTIAISIVSKDDEVNRLNYLAGGDPLKHTSPYPPLGDTIKFIRSFGFSVRLSCIMCKGYTDSIGKIIELVSFAKRHGVAQLTLIPVTKPMVSEDAEASQWVTEHQVEMGTQTEGIVGWFYEHATPLLRLPHGAVVFDLNGQNVCVSNCLTETTDPNAIRQLIYFLSDGSLRYSWQYEGAIILGPIPPKETAKKNPLKVLK